MKHQITIKITAVKDKLHHEDLSALGEYLVTFDSDQPNDLGSKSMSTLMSTVPISYPEDLAFSIIDFNIQIKSRAVGLPTIQFFITHTKSSRVYSDSSSLTDVAS